MPIYIGRYTLRQQRNISKYTGESTHEKTHHSTHTRFGAGYRHYQVRVNGTDGWGNGVANRVLDGESYCCNYVYKKTVNATLTKIKAYDETAYVDITLGAGKVWGTGRYVCVVCAGDGIV